MNFIIATILALSISISAFSARVETKPLNQNQVKFRRLPPKEFSAAIGSSITIECEAGGSPPPSIHWLKNGGRMLQNDLDENQLEAGLPVQVDEVNRIALSATRSRLFIDCANYDDEAVYSCVAENAFTRISSHTKLNLIRPLPATGNENDLLAGPMEEATMEELAAAANKPLGETVADGGGPEGKGLTAVPHCLSQRGAKSIEPLRIHMWTHNIVEVMRNSVILYCRSNANKRQSNNNNQQQQTQDMSATTTLTDLIKNASSEQQQLNKNGSGGGGGGGSSGSNGSSSSTAAAASISWTLPDDKFVGTNQKDKYEILETGDLLIKDLRWADMGSYVCTVSDEQGSDSVSAFVYPASVKSNTKRSTITPRLANFR